MGTCGCCHHACRLSSCVHAVTMGTHTPLHTTCPLGSGSAGCSRRPSAVPTCVFEARSAMLPLAHRACWKAGCVLTKVVSPTALPTLLTAVSSRKCEGKRGVRNSQETQTVYSTDVVKRKRCGWRRTNGRRTTRQRGRCKQQRR